MECTKHVHPALFWTSLDHLQMCACACSRHNAHWRLLSSSAPKLTQTQRSNHSIGIASADDLDINNILTVFKNQFNVSYICIRTREMLGHLSLVLNA